uniref:Secreted protein n=1 Tax=Panstrongylus lignarius TaxID=156445 RepID=A0A224XWX1_9HEMI
MRSPSACLISFWLVLSLYSCDNTATFSLESLNTFNSIFLLVFFSSTLIIPLFLFCHYRCLFQFILISVNSNSKLFR